MPIVYMKNVPVARNIRFPKTHNNNVPDGGTDCNKYYKIATESYLLPNYDIITRFSEERFCSEPTSGYKKEMRVTLECKPELDSFGKMKGGTVENPARLIKRCNKKSVLREVYVPLGINENIPAIHSIRPCYK